MTWWASPGTAAAGRGQTASGVNSERLLIEAYAGAGVEGRPGLILFVQTFGDLVTFNPHIHVLAADGVFRAAGAFAVLPAIPVKLLERGVSWRTSRNAASLRA